MKKNKISSQDKLFTIASCQMGHFTSKQAIQSGFPDNNHSYHVKSGHWERKERGIYRLKNYPVSDFEELMILYLWTKNQQDIPQGVFSHDTALDLYELSDINPPKIHITVPTTFRSSTKASKKICLHKNTLNVTEIKGFHGMKITTPIRTLLDLVHEGEIADELIKQAIGQGLKKGIISQKQIDEYPEIIEY